jgi:UDP-N-acetylmuramoyl-L-alanyl-D-glutamate--2,6-diaminopimelate ligase
MMAVVATLAMSLGELLGAAAGDAATVTINDLVADSRQVTPGAAFVALPGIRSHGLDFAADALARGAVAVLYDPASAAAAVPQKGVVVAGLAERIGELARTFYGQGRAPIRLTGVTGTNGKSTVAYLIAAARTRLGHRCAYLGTLGYGVPPSLEPQALTTPDCLSLHRSLRSLETDEASMEVSSHAIVQDRIAGLTFATAVFTNLTRDHLDFHGDLKSYGAAKARLFSRDGLEHAVVFIDDAFGAELARSLPRKVVPLTVSFAGPAAIEGRLTASGLDGITVEVRTAQGRAVIDSPLIGDINAENLLCALGGLLAAGTPLDAACVALAECPALPGRMQLLGGGELPWVVIDYAHTPDAMRRVVANLVRFATGDLWCVFGCGGERDRGKRPEMGAAASRAAHIVLTDDNPRGEDPAAIVEDIRGGIPAGVDVIVEHDRRRAIALAIERSRAGDVVLIAGRGHETTQLIAGRREPFVDRAVAASLLGVSV